MLNCLECESQDDVNAMVKDGMEGAWNAHQLEADKDGNEAAAYAGEGDSSLQGCAVGSM